MKIRVTDTVRGLALARMLEDLSLPGGAQLYLTDVREDWARATGLRQSDLDMVLRQAIRRYGVEMEWRTDEVLVQFPAETGGSLARSLRRLGGSLERARARAVIWYARRRRPPREPRRRQHRLTDRIGIG